MGWSFHKEDKKNIEPLKNKPMPVQAPITKKIPLTSNQYYQGVYTKKHIILHHTAGGSAASSIAGWAATPEHIATPYVVDRNGDIFECFDPKYWAYSLGVKGQTGLEKATIAIEIACYGALTAKNGKWVTYTGKEIPAGQTVKLDTPFRSFQVWEAYTPEQIASLKQLLPYLIDKFKIILQADRKNFWEFQNPATLSTGIYSHTTVRKDKIDIFPQKELVDLVYSL
jgi:N-acetyl-anhydromuramyl-L-alanine amidase AmpD